MPMLDAEAMNKAIDSAIATGREVERERCAKVLEDKAQWFNKRREPGMANHCRALAAEIRRAHGPSVKENR